MSESVTKIDRKREREREIQREIQREKGQLNRLKEKTAPGKDKKNIWR